MSDMKHTLFLCVAALMLAACTRDEMDTLPDGARPLTLTATLAGNADTRATVDGNWNGGEKVALQVDQSNYYDYTVIDQDGRMTGNYYWQDNVQSISIQGFCPSDKIRDNLVCSVETDQSIEEDYHNSDLLCSALRQNVSKDNSSDISLSFYHQTAKIIVNVTNGGYLSGVANSDVSMTINDLYTSATFARPIAQTGSIGAGKWSNHSNPQAITPHKAATTSGNYAATFEALVIPQTVSAGTTLFQFNVGDVGPFNYNVTSPITWQTGMKYTYNVTLKAEDQTVTVSSISADGWGHGGNYDLETE